MCNRRWDSLVDLAVMLHEKKVVLDDLVRQIQPQEIEIEIGGSVSTSRTKKRSRNELIWGTSVSNKRRKITDLHHQLLLGQTGIWRKPFSIITVSAKKKKSAKVLDGRRRFRGSFSSKMMKKKQGTIILSEEMKKVIVDCGGSEESAVFVIDKTLTRSDVNPALCRLSIPHGQINEHLLAKLYPSEAARLQSVSDGGIPVMLFVLGVGGGKEQVLRFKNWNSNSMYALNEGWNHIIHRNNLKVDQPIQLWSFRRNSQLCLALKLEELRLVSSCPPLHTIQV